MGIETPPRLRVTLLQGPCAAPGHPSSPSKGAWVSHPRSQRPLRAQGEPHLQAWCTRSTLQRYLTARSWHTDNAAKMLRASFEWRCSYQPHLITWNDVKEEAESGARPSLKPQLPDRDPSGAHIAS